MSDDNDRKKLSKEITVEIPDFREKKFRSANSILTWAENEKKAWESIKPKMDSHNPFANSFRFDDLIGQANQIVGFARQYMSASNEPDVKQAEHQIQASMDVYSRADWLVAESPNGQRVINLAQNGEYTAAWIALVTFRKQKAIFTQIDDVVEFMNGWEKFYIDSIDAESAVASQRKSLVDLRNEWEDNYEKLYDNMSDNLRDARSWKQRFKKISLGLSRKYEQLHTDHDNRMNAMEQAYSTEMQLRSAEKFWGKKRRLNRKRARAAFIKLAITAAIGSLILGAIFLGLKAAIGIELKWSVIHALAYGIPTILFLWLLKIFASDYRLNQNQADDAEEREAMVLTFKALEFEERVGDEERLVILNALFRPHNSSAEDSLPLPAWEAIIGRLNK